MTEKVPGSAPWLGAVFNFSRGAQMSMGAMPIGLSGIGDGVPRLCRRHAAAVSLGLRRNFEGMKAWQESDDVAEK